MLKLSEIGRWHWKTGWSRNDPISSMNIRTFSVTLWHAEGPVDKEAELWTDLRPEPCVDFRWHIGIWVLCIVMFSQNKLWIHWRQVGMNGKNLANNEHKCHQIQEKIKLRKSQLCSEHAEKSKLVDFWKGLRENEINTAERAEQMIDKC